ncbi:metalloregulator ArsR/SmtB family transcription factor [Alisedimentitalea sp. MJ-SS2]|uniref:ArsR/SmtB family transcription factor n=1 Tax=Aliisedimentitalea sp. MJ-SS2 TaxID=3049795 RepID=UPI00290F0FF8|nr:metalloregulator ArsR/SmtB family transcription factor [Alisedimentitalea sp. MJ-SS2]MDU8928453.1 metalloregulator ArsR/SmtB family transcription factor [Alisedimentitalea sp. MJ-SS2]
MKPFGIVTRKTMTPQSAFRALSDPTRRDILCLLGSGEMTVAQVSDRFDMTRAAIKKHLNVLEDGALITVRRQGRETYNALRPEGMEPVRDWLTYFDQFWTDRLSDLKTTIENREFDND